MKAKREELNQLRQQELELELKTEGGHSKLVQLAKLVHGTRVNISQVNALCLTTFCVFLYLELHSVTSCWIVLDTVVLILLTYC